MFNRQLKQNIKALDVEISKINKEIEELEYDNRYEVKKRTLLDMIEFRDILMKNQREGESSDSIVELDEQIIELAIELSNLEIDERLVTKMKQLDDLTKIRKELSECKVRESRWASIMPIVVSGGISISAMLLILKYEEEDIITSKAFNIALSLFRRG